MSETNKVAPGTLVLKLELSVDVVNYLLKVLDESSLPHKDIKTVSAIIAEQGQAQVNAWLAEQEKEESVPE